MTYNQQWLNEPYSSQTDLLGVDSQPEAAVLDFSDFIANWQAAPFFERQDAEALDEMTLAAEGELPPEWLELDQQQDLEEQFNKEVYTPLINGDIDDQARQAINGLDIDQETLKAPDMDISITQEQTHELDDFGR